MTSTPAAGLLPLDEDPTEAWPILHRRLNGLLRQSGVDKHFGTRLQQICHLSQHLLQQHPDESLFVLVQMLPDRHFGYSTTHALLAAVTCQLVAAPAGLSPDETQTLIQAALTMNMGMSHLHDQLAQQLRPADDHQRQQIAEHPKQSVQLLRQQGVLDATWLQLVEDHHETPDGQGYPAGKTELSTPQQILHMADLLVARISPRSSRRGLSPSLAVGNLYLAAQEQSSPLGAILVKQLGMYPPGTFVRLRNDETAVVVRRGARVNTPLTMAIADGAGMPYPLPARRDTQIPTYAIQGSVAPEDIKIRIDAARLLKRI